MDIQYKPGCANVVPDTLSRVVLANETVPSVSLSTYFTVEQASLLAPLIAHFGEDTGKGGFGCCFARTCQWCALGLVGLPCLWYHVDGSWC